MGAMRRSSTRPMTIQWSPQASAGWSSSAAAGSSKKEIAQTLVVTLKGVEAHLASADRKLDSESRTQLPAVLRPAA
jgi:prolyl-tRNA editing enzyme YbaK/EbsC (Cys-tRNA(Pro) deacylase)